jgi:hypothetical protein
MTTITRGNERSWAISMISDINISLQDMELLIKRAGGETTISVGHQRMFPDVLLYGDTNQTKILQGWELKLPDTPITDRTFIEDAQRKALSLGLNSCFIWNFTAGVLYVKKNNNKFEIVKQWNETNNVRTRADVGRLKDEWLPAIKSILLELNEYLKTGQIRSSSLGEILSDTVTTEIIERNKELVAQELLEACNSNSSIGAFLNVWWNVAREDYANDEKNMYYAYAKEIILNWSYRFIFAHLIQTYHTVASKVKNINFGVSIKEASIIFSEITRRCDFFNVFHGMEYNDKLPDKTWHDLIDLNIFLTENGISQIEQSALQNIMERTVASAKREINGQFTTPETLADLLVKITTKDWNGDAIDPCCGTGSISRAILKNKCNRLQDVRHSVNTTWAEDKFSFPVQLTNINMTMYEAINIPSRIFKNNVFTLKIGKKINVTNPQDGSKLALQIPAFKTIVSNLPFVEFEKIPAEDKVYINILLQEIMNQTHMVLDRRTDYYCYIIIYLYKILAENGRLGIITSNSWLATVSGRKFYEVLQYYFKLEQIHIAASGRWFKNAQVVTIINVLSKKHEIRDSAPRDKTAFCTWNKSIEELSSDHYGCDTIVDSSLLSRELDCNVMTYQEYSNDEMKNLYSMNMPLSANFHKVKWLLELKEKLKPISSIFDVVRGERRGWDKMFYPEENNHIETKYLKKVLKNSRGLKKLSATASNVAFCCSASEQDLNNEGSSGTLEWIRTFENAFNEVGKPLPEVLKKPHMYWYEMRDTNTADIITTMNPGDRLFYALFTEPAFINQRLIGLRHKDGYVELPLYHALLNSVLGIFYIEAIGFGRGLGALDINKNTLSGSFMLDPNLLIKEATNHEIWYQNSKPI